MAPVPPKPPHGLQACAALRSVRDGVQGRIAQGLDREYHQRERDVARDEGEGWEDPTHPATEAQGLLALLPGDVLIEQEKDHLFRAGGEKMQPDPLVQVPSPRQGRANQAGPELGESPMAATAWVRRCRNSPADTLRREQPALFQQGPLDLLVGRPIPSVEGADAQGGLAPGVIEGLVPLLGEDAGGLVGQPGPLGGWVTRGAMACGPVRARVLTRARKHCALSLALL